MRYLTAIALLALGCGDASTPTTSDLAEAVDLSPPADLASPLDLAAPTACNLPRPHEFIETIFYTFVQIGGSGPPLPSGSSTSVAVNNLGQITRPKVPLASPSMFTCTFTEANVSDVDCTAPCCPGQPTSPTVYVDNSGWATWVTGSCSFSIGATQYVATITNIGTSTSH
jgi:hypothetical protein